jgi:hypothetical protein
MNIAWVSITRPKVCSPNAKLAVAEQALMIQMTNRAELTFKGAYSSKRAVAYQQRFLPFGRSARESSDLARDRKFSNVEAESATHQKKERKLASESSGGVLVTRAGLLHSAKRQIELISLQRFVLAVPAILCASHNDKSVFRSAFNENHLARGSTSVTNITRPARSG